MEVKTHFLLILTSQERKSLREVHHLVSERFQQDHRTLSPVFSLLIVKPHLVQSVSFPGLFCPCPRLQLASGTLSSKPFLVGCLSRCQGFSYVWCRPWAHLVALFPWAEYTTLSFPNSLLVTRHMACPISHPTNNPTARVIHPIWQISQLRNRATERLVRGHPGTRSHFPGCGAHTLHRSASLSSRRKSMNNCRCIRPHISTPWQVLSIIHILYWSSQMFGWGTPKGKRHILNV